uniref:Secreted protein n=1 Tax=Knipowitschia caucasica TaxID=637954 RepID=A0AAV2J9F4_KNICA
MSPNRETQTLLLFASVLSSSEARFALFWVCVCGSSSAFPLSHIPPSCRRPPAETFSFYKDTSRRLDRPKPTVSDGSTPAFDFLWALAYIMFNSHE